MAGAIIAGAQIGAEIYSSISASNASSAKADAAQSLSYFNQRKQCYVQIILLTKQQITLYSELGKGLIPGVDAAIATYQKIVNQSVSKAPAKSELKELNNAKTLLTSYQNSIASLTAELNSKGITTSTIAGISQGVIPAVSGILDNTITEVKSFLGLTNAQTNTSGTTTVNGVTSATVTPNNSSGSILLIFGCILAAYYGYKKYAKKG